MSLQRFFWWSDETWWAPFFNTLRIWLFHIISIIKLSLNTWFVPGACVYLVSSLDDSQVSCWSCGWECPSRVGFLVGAPFKSCPIFEPQLLSFSISQRVLLADLVTSRLMNKTDLASEEELATTENAWNPRSSGLYHSLPPSSMVTCQVLQALNSNAELIRCTYGKARCFGARHGTLWMSER